MQQSEGKLYETLSPELTLVLLCSKLEIQEKEQEVIDKLITAGGLDWNQFLHLTLHHRLYPLVCQGLGKCNDLKVPREIIAALRQERNRNVSKTLPMTGELIKVMGAMSKKGIRAVVLKGFPLAKLLYKDLTLRTSRDLDILVWPKDVHKARRVLEESGYFLDAATSQLTDEQLKKWMKVNQHLHYWDQEKNVCIELHWRLDCHGMNIPLPALENNLDTMEIAGQPMKVLGKEELLLYLVLHGASHAWFRFKWLIDVDILIKNQDFSWKRLYALADQLAVRSVLNQGIFLSRELLGTVIPSHVAERVAMDKRGQRLAFMAVNFIRSSEYKTKGIGRVAIAFFQWHRYQFYLQAAWRKKISLLARCFLPSEEDFKMISLSEKMYFIYYMMSPFTWLGRRLWNAVKRCRAEC